MIRTITTFCLILLVVGANAKDICGLNHRTNTNWLKLQYTAPKKVCVYPSTVSAVSGDSAKDAKLLGFQDGYNYYQPNTERMVGATGIFLPFVSLPGCIYYSFKKVTEKDALGFRYHKNKDENYRQGYLAGASKRRRVAAWSCFGASLGAVGAIGLLYNMGNGQ